MTEHLSEEDVLAAVPGLTFTRLATFVEIGIVKPLRRETDGEPAHVFRRIDIARLHLLCDLADDLELDEEALDLVITLIDQLHAARHDLRAIARALEEEPPDVRARLGVAIRGSR